MARRSDHSREELNELLLKASSKIVEEDGFEGLSARRVAKEIGYAPGTIYNLFSSMDDLCLALNRQTLDRLNEMLSSPQCNDPMKTPVKNMKEMARLYRDFAHDNRSHWLMLFSHSLPAGVKAPDWYQEKVSRLFDPLEALLKPFFSIQQGRKRKMAARVLWSSVHGLVFLEATGKLPLVGDHNSVADMAGYLIDNFILGIERDVK